MNDEEETGARERERERGDGREGGRESKSVKVKFWSICFLFRLLVQKYPVRPMWRSQQ
jgi:hypothetical protein